MVSFRNRSGQGLPRLHALSQFLLTSRLPEDQTLTAARAWINGVDSAETAAGRTLRETVRRNSNVRIFLESVEERAASIDADPAVVFSTFKAERPVAMSQILSRQPRDSAGVFALVVMGEFLDWITDSYSVTSEARDAWLVANQAAIGLQIEALRAQPAY